MQIGEDIRACRIEAGLSQEALGERLNVTRQAVSKWESGVTAPDVALLPRLAQILGVTIDALFSANPPRRYGAYGSRRGGNPHRKHLPPQADRRKPSPNTGRFCAGWRIGATICRSRASFPEGECTSHRRRGS